jgi:multidrug efflux pump subunit AcrB
MKNLIAYFCRKPLLTNVVMFGVLLMGLLLWGQISKEELPEFSMNFLRATVAYPGASAQDVELFVTKPIEENLKSVSGIYEISSTSSYGAASFRITVDPNIRGFEFREKVLDLKDAIERTELPRETEDPLYSQFNSAEKAIIDLGLYLDGHKTLDTSTR